MKKILINYSLTFEIYYNNIRLLPNNSYILHMIERLLQNQIQKRMEDSKAIIVLGPRQVW